MNTAPVNEYGCRILTAADRMERYTDKLGEDEATIKRIAQGIAVKRKLLAGFRNIDAEKAAKAARITGEPVVVVKARPLLRLQR